LVLVAVIGTNGALRILEAECGIADG
jgi:hypothetical protein